jgi:hypothetical protein
MPKAAPKKRYKASYPSWSPNDSEKETLNYLRRGPSLKKNNIECGLCIHFELCSKPQVKNVKQDTTYCQWPSGKFSCKKHEFKTKAHGGSVCVMCGATSEAKGW